MPSAVIPTCKRFFHASLGQISVLVDSHEACWFMSRDDSCARRLTAKGPAERRPHARAPPRQSRLPPRPHPPRRRPPQTENFPVVRSSGRRGRVHRLRELRPAIRAAPASSCSHFALDVCRINGGRCRVGWAVRGRRLSAGRTNLSCCRGSLLISNQRPLSVSCRDESLCTSLGLKKHPMFINPKEVQIVVSAEFCVRG